MSNKRNLLIIVLVLASLRFIFQPLWQYQNDNQEVLAQLVNQQEKAERLLESRSNLSTLTLQSQEQLERLQQRFPLTASSSQLRLQVQQNLQETLNEHDVQLQTMEWLTEESLNTPNLRRHLARISVKGSRLQLMQLSLNLSESHPYIRVAEWSLKQSRGSRARQSELNLELMATVTARLGEDI